MRKLVFATLLLSGCVSMTEPVQTDDHGGYVITLNAHGGFHNDGELLTESIDKARSFCAAKGLDMEVQKTNVSGTQGWTPQNNQVFFRCTPKPAAP